MSAETCACGAPLHYLDRASEAAVQSHIDKLGPNIRVKTPAGTWEVPRHYIGLHGLKVEELPQLAKQYGFRRLN